MSTTNTGQSRVQLLNNKVDSVKSSFFGRLIQATGLSFIVIFGTIKGLSAFTIITGEVKLLTLGSLTLGILLFYFLLDKITKGIYTFLNK